MPVVKNADGEVVQRSRNLAGIRQYVAGKHGLYRPIERLSIIERDGGAGRLYIQFENGCTYETDFASWAVLKQWVRRWRNVYGSPLLVNGVYSGTVSSDNPALEVSL